MFGKKNKIILTKASTDFEVIPQEFYGAQDPVISYQKNNQNIKQDYKDSTSLPSSSFFSDLFKNKKILIIIGSILFLILVGVIIWYYLSEAGIITKKVKNLESEKVQVQTNEIESADMEDQFIKKETIDNLDEEITTSTERVDEEITTSTEEIAEIENLSNQEIDIIFPKITFTNSVDLDSDGLTDLEEEIFGTDSGNSDTDGDGYYDGLEVNNLYNPRGFAPVKLIDSGLVAEYVNPIWQYRLYYPTSWQIGEVDSEYRQVLFSTATGDFIEVLVMQKQTEETFDDWFANKAVGQRITDLQDFKNRFQEIGKKRQDNLVNYFIKDNNIYIIIYHPVNENGFIPFRQIIQMMTQSFRPTKTHISIPEQTILPVAPTVEEIEDIFLNSLSQEEVNN